MKLYCHWGCLPSISYIKSQSLLPKAVYSLRISINNFQLIYYGLQVVINCKPLTIIGL